ncbi:hypothetical protein [Deinococcus kurensis]|uniref:hypothetical protein n=1 Tax=Deinococcus kurensis TaxID=2662757 RepID=UPI0012D2AE94|nr:hypothetical protein [Deinococcus kurensis]
MTPADRHLSRLDAQQGFSLVLALSLVALLSIMLISYSLLTVNNARTAKASSSSSAGFYAAEAALNARADRIRGLFKSFRTPSGTPPTPANACNGINTGTDDMKCETTVIAGRNVQSYVWRSEAPYAITVPAGERFAGLVGEETPFSVRSQALNTSGNPEAIASMTFRSRVIPLFQFAVFFDKDMEFDNTAKLDFSGPIHSNGNIFLDSGNGDSTSLTLRGQVTAAYDIYRRQKRDATCWGTVKVAAQDTSLIDLPCSGDINSPYSNDYYQTRYGGTVESNIGRLDVPSIAALQPTASAEYWQKADLRIVLKKTSGVSTAVGTYEPYFVTSLGVRIPAPTCISTTVNPAVPLAVSYSDTLRDTREARYWESPAINRPERSNKIMLDIDVRQLLSCIETPTMATTLGILDGLQNSTEGGLVIYMTVDDRGPAGSTVTSSLLGTLLTDGNNGAIAQSNPPVPNNYGVRLYNATVLASLSGGKPKGVTFVTDQAAFIQGDFNSASADSSNWVPAAILADSMNVLSNNWWAAAPNGKHEYIGNDNPDGFLSLNCWRRENGGWKNGSCPTGSDAVNLYGSTFNGRTLYRATRRVNNVLYYVYDDADITARFPGFGLGAGTAANQAATFNMETPGVAGVSRDIKSQYGLPDRLATTTTINAAILAGTATTGQEGQLSYGSDVQSGGVHNMMRFHEEWGANGGHPNGIQTYNYRGSLVSLDKPQHAAGSFQVGASYYTYNPPLRQWSFETNFRQTAKLPPLTPRFVYIKQENFTRDFQQ